MEPIGNEQASYRAKVDPSGRILLPADMRARLGIVQGDELILAPAADRVVVMTADQALREAQAYFAGIVPSSVSLVDELLQERRDEAARE